MICKQVSNLSESNRTKRRNDTQIAASGKIELERLQPRVSPSSSPRQIIALFSLIPSALVICQPAPLTNSVLRSVGTLPLFLAYASPAFLPSKMACMTHKLRHFGVCQQYRAFWRRHPSHMPLLGPSPAGGDGGGPSPQRPPAAAARSKARPGQAVRIAHQMDARQGDERCQLLQELQRRECDTGDAVRPRLGACVYEVPIGIFRSAPCCSYRVLACACGVWPCRTRSMFSTAMTAWRSTLS